MNRKPYSSAIKKTPFKYPIAKKIAKLMLDGLDREEVYKECFENNYIEIESLDRRREITNVLYGRLITLDFFYPSDQHAVFFGNVVSPAHGFPLFECRHD